MSAVVLHLGDCWDVLETIKPDTVDCVLTDPPYGVEIGKNKDMRANGHGLAKQSYATYDDTRENLLSIIVPRISQALEVAQRGAVFPGPNIQDYPRAAYVGGVYCPAGAGRCSWGFITFLPVLFYGVAPDLQRGAKPNTITSNATAEKNGHPCPKPLAWMEWLIKLTTRPGETVLDPFMGSGTTGVACLRTGRNFIGCEIDPAYFEIARKRIEAEQNRHPLFERPHAPVVKHGRVEHHPLFAAGEM